MAPVAPAIIAAWASEPGVRSRVLERAGEPIAYGELWIDDEQGEVELARVIVDPALRGLGFGRELVDRLAWEARRLHPLVVLRVQPGNEPAMACYRRAGFARVDAATERDWNAGQPVPYVWMRSG